MSISGTDPEWIAIIEKFKNGINATDASKDKLGDYIETRIYAYTQNDLKDYSLWGIFQEDFQEWTIDDFRRSQTIAKTRLRLHLLQRGVYVARHSNRYPLAKALFDVIQEEEPHQWTDDELASNFIEVKPMITLALAEHLNSILDNLAITPLY